MIETAQLDSQIRGRVIKPDNPAYDNVRQVFAGGIDRHPAAIVRVAGAEDVAVVINYARERGLELAVRSGGHSGAGHGVSEGGIVIDLRDLRGLEIDPTSRTTWAQTGLTARDYSVAAHQFGLATGFGDAGSVGLGGLTLGGGVGYLTRKHGLTIDSLLAAEVVTADGETLVVDAECHPDLFWAIRGGGGNFGVATRFKFRLHEAGMLFGGMLMLPATAKVVEDFVAIAQAAPDELSTIANVMPAPPLPFIPAEQRGKLVILGLTACLGPLDRAERTVAPLRALAQPVVDMLRPMPYPELYPPEDAAKGPAATTRMGFADSFGRAAAEAIIERLGAANGAMRVVQIRVLGGQVARVPVAETAYAHRNRPLMVNVTAVHAQPDDAVIGRDWVDDLSRTLCGDEPGAYVNFLAGDGAARIHEAYPSATWDRLKLIKARYDPTNLFQLNHNVAPEKGGHDFRKG